MMNLRDTVEPMLSDDYKERFRAEYMQTKYRYDRLHDMVVRYEAGTLNFKPTCSIELLKQQKSAMGQYLYSLEVRAQVEHIQL
ncbi:MAG: crAss001_48 related protein [Candidatus Ventricola sp.]